MRVHRSASKRNFTVLSNSLLQDRGLKCAERGLLTFLLSLPDNVRMTAADIAYHTQDSLYLIRKSLRG